MTFTRENQPLKLNRPCPPKANWNAKRQLALDLSLVNLLAGPDDAKATRIYRLPLMEVAMQGGKALKKGKK